MTKLEAVNEILIKTGGHPVATLDSNGNSSAAMVERFIDAADLEIQSEGWHFNTRADVELTPDTGTGRIPVPAYVISIDTDGADYSRDVVQEGLFLYDKDENTDVFTESVRVKYVQRVGFDCIPIPVRKYIVAKAALVYAESRKMFEMRSLLISERNEAATRAKRFTAETSDVNLLNTPEMRRLKGNRDSGFGSVVTGSTSF